jgi:hypothetical protein
MIKIIKYFLFERCPCLSLDHEFMYKFPRSSHLSLRALAHKSLVTESHSKLLLITLEYCRFEQSQIPPNFLLQKFEHEDYLLAVDFSEHFKRYILLNLHVNQERQHIPNQLICP